VLGEKVRLVMMVFVREVVEAAKKANDNGYRPAYSGNVNRTQWYFRNYIIN
jgi:hypothetical protein